MAAEVGLGERVRASISRTWGAEDEPLAVALTDWIELVAKWNAKIDLTAARNDDELVDLCIADALVVAPKLAKGKYLVDVGTGAGAPGLPLSLARVDVPTTLVEPMQKRISFLRTAQVSLRAPAGWKRPVLERARGEEILAKKIHFDVAIARATLPPPAWVELGAKLADEVWVLLAKDEAPPAPTGFSQGETLAYEWPLTGAKRRAIVYRKDR